MKLRIGGPVLAACLVLAAGFVTAKPAAEGQAGLVEKRITHMRGIADDMRVVADMLFGIAPFDAAQVERLAGRVQTRAGGAMTGLFPTGSVAPSSRAKPEIWKGGALDGSFAKTAGELADLAEQLQRHAQSEGKAGTIATVQKAVARSAFLNVDRSLLAKARSAMQPLRNTFMNMAARCKSCHESFRTKKEEPEDGG